MHGQGKCDRAVEVKRLARREDCTPALALLLRSPRCHRVRRLQDKGTRGQKALLSQKCPERHFMVWEGARGKKRRGLGWGPMCLSENQVSRQD